MVITIVIYSDDEEAEKGKSFTVVNEKPRHSKKKQRCVGDEEADAAAGALAAKFGRARGTVTLELMSKTVVVPYHPRAMFCDWLIDVVAPALDVRPKASDPKTIPILLMVRRGKAEGLVNSTLTYDNRTDVLDDLFTTNAIIACSKLQEGSSLRENYVSGMASRAQSREHCGICLCVFGPNMEEMRFTANCNHQFHPSCIYKMTMSRDCPVCRTWLGFYGSMFKPSP